MIFIGGAARTGKTLLKGILCKDKETFPVIRECTYLRFLINAYAQGKMLWEQHTYDYFDSKSHFANFNKNLLDEYFNYVYKRFGPDKILVHKHPALIQYFPELNELYPGMCKFIVMVRDPRDAIASFLKIKRDEGFNVTEFTGQFISSYTNFMQWYNIVNDKSNVLFIKYEELLTDTNMVMQKLRDFTGLELDFDPTIEGWDSKRGSSEYASVLDGKPIDPSNIGKYVYQLDKDELKFIESHRKEINDIIGFDIFYDNIHYSVKTDDINELKCNITFIFNNGNTEEVINLSNKGTELFPFDPFFHKTLGLIYEELNEITKGFENIQKAMKLTLEEDYLLYNCLGLLYYKINDFDNALKCLEKCKALKPDFADVYHNIARVYNDKQETEKSIEYSKKSMELDETFRDAEYTMEESILNKIVKSDEEKIFCIGMNRTGTTSVGKSLELLGYKLKGEVAKQDKWMMKDNMDVISYVLEVSENYQAFTHEPWNVLYKELDKKYKNAKFILTLRDEKSWLKSFYNYFKYTDNEWAPFLLKTYGINNIDEGDDEFFLEKFRLHNLSVINYFKGRISDLLVINVFEGDGWNKICPFLNIDIPAKPFPFVNKGKYKE